MCACVFFVFSKNNPRHEFGSVRFIQQSAFAFEKKDGHFANIENDTPFILGGDGERKVVAEYALP